MIDYCEFADSRQDDSQKNQWGIPPSMLKCPVDSDADAEWYSTATLTIHPDGYALFDEYLYSSLKVAFRALPHCDPEKETFIQLAGQWKDETWFLSSIKKRVAHLAYLKIIGLGHRAIPWILAELEREPDYWYAALEAIARPNPVPNAETMPQLREAWLAWGRMNGYIR